MAKFVPRERKHKRLAKRKTFDNGEQDANADVILPKTQTEKANRRAAIAADLRSQQPDKISSKKRKRLDKYIDTKLRKDENLELLKKLAASKVDTSLFQSSKKLGRVHENKRERLSRALREQQAGLDVNGDHDDVLYQRRTEAARDSESEAETGHQNGEIQSYAFKVQSDVQAISTFGSGLKRPLKIGEEGQPLIKRRKRQGRSRLAISSAHPTVMADDDTDSQSSGSELHDEHSDSSEEWQGFESDAQSDLADQNEETSGISDDDRSSSETSVSDSSTGKPARVSAFKAWADMQRNVASDFTPSTVPLHDASIRAKFKPRQPSPDPLLPTPAQNNGERSSRPAAAITIPRSDEIQALRMELPVVQEEQKIMEAIHSNPVVVVCGATGSGKTTQVPQMMFESGYGSQIGMRCKFEEAGSQSQGMIGVTQPRRVAATSVAERVATELGQEYRNRVAHQVRYDSNVSRHSAIKFMTDGILLREISQDFILSKYSAIIIDEAHERSVNTDILIGMLSRIINLRAQLAKEEPNKHYPLKLVVMSATLRVADFTENERLFRDGAPPIVQAEGRQYPVTVHFSRRTQRDYVSEIVEKVARGHRKLPAGGMLVFLTAQNEIQAVAKKLKERLGGNTAGHFVTNGVRAGDADDFEDADNGRAGNEYLEGEEDLPSDEEDIEIKGLDNGEDQEFAVDDVQAQPGAGGSTLKPHILPLYAALPSSQQLKVFQPPPAGSRLIVLATNVAETSLTIPGIRYVFDCGRAKEKRYNTSTGVQTFEVDWISKSSASQRQGRAGRTGPGHCYRLYSSAVYEQFFAEHTVPEILRTPLESTVLQLKNMEIENIVNFPFPTAPDRVQLAAAEKLLENLGAIEKGSGGITEMGRELIQYPVSPRFGKMLLFGRRNGVLAHTVALVAGLAVGDLSVPEAQLGVDAVQDDSADSADGSDHEHDRARRRAESAANSEAQVQHQAFTRAQATLARWDDHSDAIKLLTTVAAHAESASKSKSSTAAVSKFCQDFFLREKGMSEVQQLRHQLHNIVSSHSPHNTVFQNVLSLPSEKERKMLNQIVAVGFLDQVAIRADLLNDQTPSRKPRRANEVAYRTLQPSHSDKVENHTRTPEQIEQQRNVFVHATSVLARLSVKEMPDYIIYSHLSRAAPTIIDSTKLPRTRMHPLTTVSLKQLVALAEGTPLLEVGKPMGKIEEMEGGRRRCWVGVSVKAPGGAGAGVAWPGTAWKVVQVKKAGVWEVDKVVAR